MRYSPSRMLFTLLLLAVTCLPLKAAESSKAAPEPTGTVTGHGILKVVSDGAVSAKIDGPTGERLEVKRVVIADPTTKIPAVMGTAFGIEYTITGLPAEQLVELKKVVKYPEITKPDGTRQTSHSVPLPKLTDATGAISSFEGYKFTEAYEIVPGTWTFEIWHGQQRLVQQAFEVVP